MKFYFYNVGECFPLTLPLGCLIQVPAVNEEIEDAEVPQYLH
ncbi:hypothetical protein [Flavobacterium rakeshii]|nr:hypothetical protein [Flavobacterium rakeshii]